MAFGWIVDTGTKDWQEAPRAGTCSRKSTLKPGMVAHAFNLMISGFEDSQGYTENPCLKKTKKKEKKSL